MRKTVRIAMVVLCGGLASLVPAEGAGQIAMTSLAARADLVVVAELLSATGSAPTETVQLQIVRTLSGQALSSSLSAALPVPPAMQSSQMGALATGAIGVWFLGFTGGSYQVLPLMDGFYAARDLFLPVSDPSVAPIAGTVEQQLLAYLTAWYGSLPSPAIYEDQRAYLGITKAGQQQDGLAAASALIGSVRAHQHTMGLAAAISLGSDSAISALANEIATVQPDQGFRWVLDALRIYRPSSGSSPTSLESLALSRPDIPDLDAAVAAALQKFRSSAALPGMVSLLDSKDPNAQLAAALFFGNFALFADEAGNMPNTGIVGPFATEDTRQYTPTNNSTLTPAQYAGFWKVWWVQNKAMLGY